MTKFLGVTSGTFNKEQQLSSSSQCSLEPGLSPSHQARCRLQGIVKQVALVAHESIPFSVLAEP